MAKVGDLEKQETEKKKKGRQDYDVAGFGAANDGAVDAEGLLTISPPDFHYRKFNPLKKEAFASEATYVLHQAMLASQKSEFFALKAQELTGKAERLAKFGSEVARKAAGKLAKAKAQMAKIRQQLIDTGMSAEEIDGLIENM